MARRNPTERMQNALQFETQVAELTKIYAKAQRKLNATLRRVDLTDFSRARAVNTLAQVKEIIKSLNTMSRDWSKSAMPYSYDRSVVASTSALKRLGVDPKLAGGNQINTGAVNSLVQATTSDLLRANASIGNTFQRFIRASQQEVIKDAQITRLIAEGVITGETRKQTSSSILKALQAKMKDEKYITINGRNYQPKTYAELLARTRTREASTNATINTSLQYGNDLVQISYHRPDVDGPDICNEHEGRIYSISGSNPDFPALADRPPYHPNCVHVLVPVTASVLQKRGVYDDLVVFSNKPESQIDPKKDIKELRKILQKEAA